MFVRPSVDRLRFRENLTEAMALNGYDSGGLASSLSLPEAVVSEAIVTGEMSDADLSRVAEFFGIEQRELAPLINLKDPERRDRLPIDGRKVTPSAFWERRLAEGSVLLDEPN